jgi:hypothetical protein
MRLRDALKPDREKIRPTVDLYSEAIVGNANAPIGALAERYKISIPTQGNPPIGTEWWMPPPKAIYAPLG